MRRAALLLAGVALVGCRRQAPAAATAKLGVAAVDPAQVVATVDGRPITIDDVARQARAAGTDAKTALSALVDAEVLVEEADRRGLAGAPDVRAAVEPELVRRLLATTFEHDVRPDTIPDGELQDFYYRNRFRLNHGEVREVRHVFAPRSPGDDDARRQLMRARMAEVAAAAKGVHSVDEFMALATRFSDAKLTLTAEETAQPANGWAKPFADAVFAMTTPGQVSGVVETRFGFHVIYYVGVLKPEEHVTFAEARENLRGVVWPDWQRRQFGRFVDGLTDAHHVETHPERLGAPE